MAVYTTIDNPELYFQTKLYTGSGANQSITLDGSEDMQPDLVWIKDRTNTNNQVWTDSVRGVEKVILSNATNAEATYTDGLTAFNSDGFSLGDDDDGQMNVNTNACVAWCWKAGTSFTNDASATSVGSLDSEGSINTTAGFSIIKWTNGTSSAQTIAHGLSAVPKMLIMKVTGATGSWNTYHGANTSAPETDGLYLNSTAATEDNDAFWDDTAPTSAVFKTGTNGNLINNTLVAYCFAEKQGFSKFGTFEGNANAAGPFVYCGFRPAFVMIKDIDNSGNSWLISDNKRNSFNVADDRLFADLTNAENQPSDSGGIDFVSNGFKVRTNDGSTNASGTRIFMAFAESPLVNSNGIPNNAR